MPRWFLKELYESYEVAHDLCVSARQQLFNYLQSQVQGGNLKLFEDKVEVGACLIEALRFNLTQWRAPSDIRLLWRQSRHLTQMRGIYPELFALVETLIIDGLEDIPTQFDDRMIYRTAVYRVYQPMKLGGFRLSKKELRALPEIKLIEEEIQYRNSSGRRYTEQESATKYPDDVTYNRWLRNIVDPKQGRKNLKHSVRVDGLPQFSILSAW
jgi:hypothetical protein